MSLGTLYIIAAPSGAGKTSLVGALVKDTDHIRVSVSHTTRPPRPKEQEGIHYHFVTQADFEAMIAQEAFLEQAKVFDDYYGTTKEWVSAQLHAGIDVILEIDWQGARQVRQLQPNSVSIFILPPSKQTLKQRLKQRGQDDDTVIARRMHAAINEMRHYDEFDYLVINDHFKTALADLKAIVKSRRLTRPIQIQKMGELLTDLLSES